MATAFTKESIKALKHLADAERVVERTGSWQIFRPGKPGCMSYSKGTFELLRKEGCIDPRGYITHKGLDTLEFLRR